MADKKFIAAYDQTKAEAKARNQVFTNLDGEFFVEKMKITEIVPEGPWDKAKKAVVYEERIIVLRDQEMSIGDKVNIGRFLANRTIKEYNIEEGKNAKFLAVPA